MAFIIVTIWVEIIPVKMEAMLVQVVVVVEIVITITNGPETFQLFQRVKGPKNRI